MTYDLRILCTYGIGWIKHAKYIETGVPQNTYPVHTECTVREQLHVHCAAITAVDLLHVA